MSTSLAKKIFLEFIENSTDVKEIDIPKRQEGIIQSINEFMQRVVEANKIYNKTVGIKDSKQLIFAETAPVEIFHKLNNKVSEQSVDDSTLRDIRVVTYLSKEEPGIPGSHTPNGPGVRNIKFRFAEYYPDPEYTGYSIIRFKKDIEAEVDFYVWGIHYEDIRERSKLLREMMQNSSWYFLHKGLKTIVWNGSYEVDKWDHQQVVKCKVEKYCVGFTEIIELKEKNVEQIVIELGIDRKTNGGT